jgi:hypothetical protein
MNKVTRTRGGRFGIKGPLHLMRSATATLCGLDTRFGSTLQTPRDSRPLDYLLRHCARCEKGLDAALGNGAWVGVAEW